MPFRQNGKDKYNDVNNIFSYIQFKYLHKILYLSMKLMDMKISSRILLLLVLMMNFSCFCYSQQIESIDTIMVKPQPELHLGGLTSSEFVAPSFYSTYNKDISTSPPATMHEIKPDLSRHFETKNIFVPFSPYSYSFDNPSQQGVTYQGLQHRFEITNFLTSDVNVFLSSAYFGEAYPYRYINGSINVNLKLKLFDRVKLVGEGQFSIREGLNPELPSAIGGANFYGAGVEFKVANKIGIGFGFRNYYYRGDWTRRTYVSPVNW